MILTGEILSKCFPYADSQRVEMFTEPLNHAALEFGIDTPKRIAPWLAQIAHESGSLRYVLELADGKAYEGRRDLGNVQAGDGPRFKGRGLLQVTGRANYAACGRALNRNLIEDPSYLETPMGAARSAAWFWYHKGLNDAADAERFWTISKVINGGTNGLDDRIQHYCRIRKVLGL